MDELPEEWQAPADLKQPTTNPSLNLLIQMLSSQVLGNDAILLVGRLIAEQALFSMWFGAEAKKSGTPKELALLTVKSSAVTGRIHGAWQAFVTAFEGSSRLAGSAEEERLALLETLRTGIRELAEARAIPPSV